MVPVLLLLWAAYALSWWQLALAAVLFNVWLLWADADLTTLLRQKLQGPKPLVGKTVWVTGASSGIGEACCRELAALGATLVLSARRTTELERVKAQCRVLKGAKEHRVVQLDLADHPSHAGTVAEVLRGGHVDVLLNCAGRSQRGLVEQTVRDVDQQQMQLNALGARGFLGFRVLVATGEAPAPAGGHSSGCSPEAFVPNAFILSSS